MKEKVVDAESSSGNLQNGLGLPQPQLHKLAVAHPTLNKRQ